MKAIVYSIVWFSVSAGSSYTFAEAPASAPQTSAQARPSDPAAPQPPVQDPTLMSMRFRDAMKNLAPATISTKPGDGTQPLAATMPTISLGGLMLGSRGKPSALLNIDKGGTIRVTAESKISVMQHNAKGPVVTIEVKSITEAGVELLIKPFNQYVILR